MGQQKLTHTRTYYCKYNIFIIQLKCIQINIHEYIRNSMLKVWTTTYCKLQIIHQFNCNQCLKQISWLWFKDEMISDLACLCDLLFVVRVSRTIAPIKIIFTLVLVDPQFRLLHYRAQLVQVWFNLLVVINILTCHQELDLEREVQRGREGKRVRESEREREKKKKRNGDNYSSWPPDQTYGDACQSYPLWACWTPLYKTIGFRTDLPAHLQL